MTELYCVYELVPGEPVQRFLVAAKPTERAAKLARTKLRGLSTREYVIEVNTFGSPDKGSETYREHEDRMIFLNGAGDGRGEEGETL